MFSCFINLGIPTLFSGYDLLDHSPTRDLPSIFDRGGSGSLGDRKVVVDSSVEPRASQSSGFLNSIKSFFALCFSHWLTPAEPRAAAADKNGNAGGRSEPGKAPGDVQSSRSSVTIRTLTFDSDDEDNLCEVAEEARIGALVDALSNSLSEKGDDYRDQSYSSFEDSSSDDSGSEDENSWAH